MATSNRIRHTVVTRGAQNGLPAVQLAKMTGVTVPAARHYIDLDYVSRREIDTKYIGNEFLKKAFSHTLTVVPEGDEVIVDNKFNPCWWGTQQAFLRDLFNCFRGDHWGVMVPKLSSDARS
ncbi:hypothetical protein ACPA9J_20675 [Pseudomonas aeruginosa]